MNNFINEMRQEDALTDNGALTHSTSLNNVLDLFFVAGASRNMSPSEIKRMFERALVIDEELAVRLMLWAGDIRGGAGERRFFKACLRHLHDTREPLFNEIVALVPHYNRWDSLFDFPTANVMGLIKDELANGNGLLAKWLPRKKQFNNFAGSFRAFTGMTPKEYRKRIVELTKVVETNLCNKDYSFDYSGVPSVAFKKYTKAFFRNDESNFKNFLDRAEKGEVKVNAGAIFPYDLYRSYKRGNKKAVDVQWKNLPDYIGDSKCSFLPVCDISGSMTWENNGLAMAISVSLGVYLSERNKSAFKDAFITFSSQPTLEYLSGDSAVSRFSQIDYSRGGYSTNIQAVFDLILDKVKHGKVTAADMPTHLLIISDMEFDEASEGRSTNFEVIKSKFAEIDIPMPQIVFWNVNGRAGNVPVNMNEKGVALVSGASPSIIKNLLGGKLNPIDVMVDTLMVERYNYKGE